jgi:hypothetical protein
MAVVASTPWRGLLLPEQLTFDVGEEWRRRLRLRAAAITPRCVARRELIFPPPDQSYPSHYQRRRANCERG